MEASTYILRYSVATLAAFVLCQWPVLAASNSPETVLLKCGDSAHNNDLLDKALAGQPAKVRIAFASAQDGECDVLLHHAARVPPGTDVLGSGSLTDEIPNAHFRHWSRGDRYVYSAPTFGQPKTYSGTGGLKVEHASCWVSNVWGLAGSGVIARKREDGQTHLNWVATSVEPEKNECDGQRIRCVDDPDATGYHHVLDTQAHKLVRKGTAGHDMSQIIPVDQFYSGWVTVRIRMKSNSGNNKFYVRLIQGFGHNGQLNRAVSHTLPGITLAKEGEVMDYVLITNLRQQESKLSSLSGIASNQAKYMQIALTSALPHLDHDVDVFRISLHRGINAPDNSGFGSADPQVGQRGNACN